MIPLSEGISRAEREHLYTALANSHSIYITVLLMDNEHKVRADLSDKLLSGQVDIDADAEITRSASIELLDPKGRLSFGADSPDEFTMYLNHMIRIYYGVSVPELNGGKGDWVNIPIFTGPITSLSRDAEVVSVECQGKEILAMGAIVDPFHRKKGYKKVEAIKELMRHRAGETKFDMPDLSDKRIAKKTGFSVGPQQAAWPAARKMARSMNRQLFYDGRGVLRLRQEPDKPVFTFFDGTHGKHGKDAMVMSAPSITYTTDNVINAVLVIGQKKGKDQEKHIKVLVKADPDLELSPKRLGRNGVPRYLLDVIENDHIDSRTEAKKRGQKILRRHLKQQIDVAFDALPMPMLEPRDTVKLDAGDVTAVFEVRQFSIPLAHGDTMSLGYNKRMASPRHKKPRGQHNHNNNNRRKNH